MVFYIAPSDRGLGKQDQNASVDSTENLDHSMFDIQSKNRKGWKEVTGELNKSSVRGKDQSMVAVMTCTLKIHSLKNILWIIKWGLDSCHVSLPYITHTLDPARTPEYALAARSAHCSLGTFMQRALQCRVLQAVSDIGHCELIQERSKNIHQPG